MRPVFLVDGGHGADDITKGKFSPLVAGLGIEDDPTVYDGRFREGNFNRLVASGIVATLKSLGYEAILITPERDDVSISERVRRVNDYCSKYGKGNCLLLSVHGNAAGMDGWASAAGWMSIVDDSGSVKAKDFANMLFDMVKDAGFKTRQHVPSRKFYYYHECMGKPCRLPILSKTSCPAVLTENFFYTNPQEVQLLASEAGREKIVKYHVDAMVKYAEKYY